MLLREEAADAGRGGGIGGKVETTFAVISSISNLGMLEVLRNKAVRSFPKAVISYVSSSPNVTRRTVALTGGIPLLPRPTEKGWHGGVEEVRGRITASFTATCCRHWTVGETFTSIFRLPLPGQLMLRRAAYVLPATR